MKICEKYRQINQPRIVVLTATLLSSQCKDLVELENTIMMSETTFHSTAETSTLVFSERHGTSPKEALYECNNDFDEIQQMLDVAFILQEALLFFDKCILSWNLATTTTPDQNGLGTSFWDKEIFARLILLCWCFFVPCIRFGLVSLFNGISTFIGYLMPKLFS